MQLAVSSKIGLKNLNERCKPILNRAIETQETADEFIAKVPFKTVRSKQMKVVIVEDEHLAAEKLIQQLYSIAPEVKILAVLESVEESVNWFATHSAPDLVFMDIQLDDGLSFEVFDELEVKAPVIFTTAFDEYAIRAFKVNSVDYLLKPIELEALRVALSKI